MGPADPATLPALVEALEDKDASIRHEAVLALVKMGPAGKEAIPPLTVLKQRDRNERVRTDAGRAIARLESE